MIKRRLGQHGRDGIAACSSLNGCPDVFELETGDFAIIGQDITDAAAVCLPSGSGCGPGEKIIRIPRNILVSAKRDIPDAV